MDMQIDSGADASGAPDRPFNREAQYAAKQRAVIRSAARAFRRQGYHNTPLTQIAKSLGLTKAALYYYVRSKAEILYACHIQTYDRMDGLIKANGRDGEDGLQTLCNMYEQFALMLTEDGASLLADIGALKGDYKADVLARRAKIEKAVTRIVQRGMKDGSIGGDDARLTVYFFMGALNWLNVWYEEGGRQSGAEIARHFTSQMRRGIAKRQASP